MRDSKSILLLVVSVLLILVSCALLWTWGYNFNNFSNDKPLTTSTIKDSATAVNATRDSLKKIYEATITNLGTLDSTWTQADSLKSDLDLKLSEFYKLRNEIAAILKNPAKKEDLDLAKQKIGELQKKIDQLRNTNTDVEAENKRLHEMLQQLTLVPKQASPQSTKQNNYSSRESYEKNATSSTSVIPISTFTASDLRLTAMSVDGDKEEETFQAQQVDKFVGSLYVRNNLSQFSNAEIMIVVTQPDNKVLQTSPWESGRFETRQGTKVYSCKIKFEYSKGENKRLLFSLNADKSQKGKYIVNAYYNGSLIASGMRTLN